MHDFFRVIQQWRDMNTSLTGLSSFLRCDVIASDTGVDADGARVQSNRQAGSGGGAVAELSSIKQGIQSIEERLRRRQGSKPALLTR